MALMQCPDCEREVSEMATSCPGCGYPFQAKHVSERDVAGHGIPALFSFFIPGLGQLMKGDWLGAVKPYALTLAVFYFISDFGYRLVALLLIWFWQLIDTYRIKKTIDFETIDFLSVGKELRRTFEKNKNLPAILISIPVIIIVLIIAAKTLDRFEKKKYAIPTTNIPIRPRSVQRLSQIATELNRSVPVMVDKETEMIMVEGYEGLLVYNYRLVSYDLGQVDQGKFAASAKQRLNQAVCNEPEMRDEFLKKGVTVRYSYVDKNKQHIANVDVTPKDCGF